MTPLRKGRERRSKREEGAIDSTTLGSDTIETNSFQIEKFVVGEKINTINSKILGLAYSIKSDREDTESTDYMS